MFELARVAHAGLGSICLLAGVFALVALKRRQAHRKSGMVFVFGLVAAYAAIVPNAVVDRNVFMLGIGWIGVHAAVDGVRALRRAQGRTSPAPSRVDFAVWTLTSVMSFVLVSTGIEAFVRRPSPLAIVVAGFGCLGGLLTVTAWRRSRRSLAASEWMAVHVRMMSAAFSAALTAFFAVQFSGRIGAWEWVVWAAPTAAMMMFAGRQIRRRGYGTVRA